MPGEPGWQKWNRLRPGGRVWEGRAGHKEEKQTPNLGPGISKLHSHTEAWPGGAHGGLEAPVQPSGTHIWSHSPLVQVPSAMQKFWFCSG